MRNFFIHILVPNIPLSLFLLLLRRSKKKFLLHLPFDHINGRKKNYVIRIYELFVFCTALLIFTVGSRVLHKWKSGRIKSYIIYCFEQFTFQGMFGNPEESSMREDILEDFDYELDVQ